MEEDSEGLEVVEDESLTDTESTDSLSEDDNTVYKTKKSNNSEMVKLQLLRVTVSKY